MGCTAEVPHHRWPFDLPDVPYAIVPDIRVLVKRHVQILESIGLDELYRLVRILLAEGRQQIGLSASTIARQNSKALGNAPSGF